MVGDIAQDDSTRTGRSLIKESPGNSRSSSVGPGFHHNVKRPLSGTTVSSRARRQSLDLVLGGQSTGQHSVDTSIKTGPGIGIGIGIGTAILASSSSTTAIPIGIVKHSATSPTSEKRSISEKSLEKMGLGNILTEDDLADFPDEIIPSSRKHVTKLLLQALIDVRSLDSILYKSLLWMINNDITNVIDETFSVAIPGCDRTGTI